MTDTPTHPRPAFTFRSPALPGYRFEARPFSTPPVNGYVGLIYRTTDGGKNYQQSGVGAFQDGEWKHHNKKPFEGDCFWTLMVDE